jgi:hypothetical protein
MLSAFCGRGEDRTQYLSACSPSLYPLSYPARHLIFLVNRPHWTDNWSADVSMLNTAEGKGTSEDFFNGDLYSVYPALKGGSRR